MGIDYIIAILILKQSSSALLCSRRLFVGSLLRRLFLGFRIIGILLRSGTQCLWAILEQKTWKPAVYPRDLGSRGAGQPLSHADLVAAKMTFRWL